MITRIRAVIPPLRASRTRRQRHALDRRFHSLLRDACPNRSLVELIGRLWRQAARFDGAADRGMANPTGSLREHVAITESIARGDVPGAVQQIDEHWRGGIDVVVGWLRSHAAGLTVIAAIALWGALGCTPAAPAGPATHAPTAASATTPIADATWGYFLDETAIDLLVERWSQAHRPHAAVIEHVAVVTMAHPGIDRDQTIVIDGGTLRAIGPAGSVAIPPGATVIDGRGKYVIPGLVDMHTHTNLSDSHYVLDLAAGVTSVREMDGHPFLLRQRSAARASRLLIPNLYVAGKILASAPLAWYATVVTTPDAARAAVRDQKAAGYEFIKVHNVLRPDVYDAICDEARAQGLDVVGHIPHDTSIAKALACGQRTFEHFKGYINDRNLQLTREDYVAVTRGAEVWNTPTFYTYRGQLRGDAARALVARAPEMRYVAARDRARWLALADQPADPVQQNVLPLSEKIFRDLLAIHARFLAGTDSGGGYPFNVPGFALHDELHIMARNGMSVPDVLATATVEPARAMRRDAELGTVEVGKRADLVLLARDPLASIASLDAIDGVMVRGIWLPRATLDQMLAAIAAIDRGSSHPPTRGDLDRALDTLEQLRARGYILRDHFLGWLRYHLEAANLPVDRPLFTGIAPLAPDDD